MSKVTVLCFFDWVVISVDHLVEVFGCTHCYVIQFLVIKGTIFDKHRQGDGGEVTNRHFIWRGIFQNLCTQV